MPAALAYSAELAPERVVPIRPLEPQAGAAGRLAWCSTLQYGGKVHAY
ncbi:MAG: hypothetical protein AB7L71_11020 [Vicinamibacterales bacterium]